MSVVAAAVGEGMARLRECKRQIGVAWLVSFGVAAPLAATLFVALRDDIGHEIAGENLRRGWDDHWHRAFAAQAEGIERTFDAGIVGMGAVLRALDAQITGQLLDQPAPILGAGLVYLLAWIVLSGGFVERFIRGGDGRAFWTGAFAHAPRLVIAAAIAGVGYWLWLGPIRGALGSAVAGITRDNIDERVQFAWTVGKYAVVWTGVWIVSLVHDLAKIHIVAEPDLPVFAAIRKAARSLRAHPGAFGVSAAVAGLGVAGLVAYWVIAPGAGASNAFLLLVAFLLSQLSVLLRIVIRVLGWASLTALVGIGPLRETSGQPVG